MNKNISNLPLGRRPGRSEHLEKHISIPVLIAGYKIILPEISGPLPWTRKLRQKLERIEYPELQQGQDKLSEGRWLGRQMAARMRRMTNFELKDLRDVSEDTPSDFLAQERKRFGESVRARLWDAVLRQDDLFLADFAAGMRPLSEAADVTIDIYNWMLGHSDELGKCQSVVEIFHLLQAQKQLTVSRKPVERLCREIGLPVVSPPNDVND